MFQNSPEAGNHSWGGVPETVSGWAGGASAEQISRYIHQDTLVAPFFLFYSRFP